MLSVVYGGQGTHHMIKPGPNGTGGPALLLNKLEFGQPPLKQIDALVSLLASGRVDKWSVNATP